MPHPNHARRAPAPAKPKTHPHEIEHEEFILKSTKSEYVLVDRAGRGTDVSIRFTWDGATGHYTVNIERDASAPERPYSLYNICVQNRNWTSYVTVPATQKKVKFIDGKGKKLKKNAQGESVVPYTGWVSPTVPSPNPDTICFLVFKGTTCTFSVRSERVMAGAPMPTSPSATSHDSLPPPPESGAEY
jgi:hypothetical protein